MTMGIKQVCFKAIEYSGYQYISSITQNKDNWIVSMCDKQGHDLFIEAVAIEKGTGKVYDYSILDDESYDIYENVDIPLEYQSDKEKLINLILNNITISKKYKDLLDTIYEKYDLYNSDNSTSYLILKHYYNIIINYNNTEEAYRFIIEDNRTLNELTEVSSKAILTY